VPYSYDIGAAGTENNLWADTTGRRDLGSSGATSVVFADDARVGISREFLASGANLNIGSDLPLASYTLEWWLDFGGSVVPGEVVFESGGGVNGMGPCGSRQLVHSRKHAKQMRRFLCSRALAYGGKSMDWVWGESWRTRK